VEDVSCLTHETPTKFEDDTPLTDNEIAAYNDTMKDVNFIEAKWLFRHLLLYILFYSCLLYLYIFNCKVICVEIQLMGDGSSTCVINTALTNKFEGNGSI
jgi:hypothetical protein